MNKERRIKKAQKVDAIVLAACAGLFVCLVAVSEIFSIGLLAGILTVFSWVVLFALGFAVFGLDRDDWKDALSKAKSSPYDWVSKLFSFIILVEFLAVGWLVTGIVFFIMLVGMKVRKLNAETMSVAEIEAEES